MKSPAAETIEPFRTAFYGFGTEVRVVIWPSIPMDGKAHAALARETSFLRLAEKRLSRFLPDSELSRLNAAPGTAVRVSRLTFSVIAAALSAAKATGGLFDPSVRNALIAAGYDRTFSDLKNTTGTGARQTCNRIGPSCDFQRVLLDQKLSRVTLPTSVSLDLGGIAKGWLADQAVRRLRRYGAALADLGGDIALGGPPPGGCAWRIEVENPEVPSALLGSLIVRGGGVATSGITHRRWRTQNGWQHHLIDPRTGQPAVTDLLCATIVAPSGTAAEVAAKAAILLGSEYGAAAIAATPELGGVLVRKDGTVLTVGTLTWVPTDLSDRAFGRAS